MASGRLRLGLVANFAADPVRLAQQVRKADELALSFVLFDDQLGRPAGSAEEWGLDPIEAASFAAALTTRVGLVATAAATHAEPYHLSNRFSSLDWGSSGRAGWLVTVDSSVERARAFSAPAPSPERALVEADAVLDAVRRLWDSWEDGALIADTASGRFLDRDKLHYVDAGGDLFHIRGPALMPRPVQGQVVVLAKATDRIASADVILLDATATDDLASARDVAREAGASRAFAEVAIGPVDGTWSGLGALLHRLAQQVDGVLLRADDSDAALEHLEHEVLPALRDDRVLEVARPGQTLRERLNLQRPPSRYATATTA